MHCLNISQLQSVTSAADKKPLVLLNLQWGASAGTEITARYFTFKYGKEGEKKKKKLASAFAFIALTFITALRLAWFKCLFLSFVSLARLYFPVLWRNECSCGLPYKKITRISALILNFWTLWLQSRKYFLQLWSINVSMNPGTITGLRFFFSSLFLTFMKTFCVSWLWD